MVFLGDVGVEDGQLTTEQCRLLKGLVEHQASGLVFLPGWQGREFSLLDTELGELYPVVLDAGQPGGWGARTPEHFELTEMGRRSLLTKLADTQDDNLEVWENLPGFQWYAPVVRAKAGTEVLSVHKETANEYGRLPLLVTRTYGAGKVLFMGTDGAWRWRKGVEDQYHYRFWGQVVRWMAYQRNMAKGETMRLYYVPDQPRMNQLMALRANVMDRSGEPLHQRRRLGADHGAVGTVGGGPVRDRGRRVGRLRRAVRADGGGPACVDPLLQADRSAAGSDVLRPGGRGRAGRQAGAAGSDGGAGARHRWPGHRADQDRRGRPNSLAALPEPAPSVRRVQLWSHPATALGLVTLFGVFWVGRKVVGLI